MTIMIYLLVLDQAADDAALKVLYTQGWLFKGATYRYVFLEKPL
jgi:hypothetical protein